MFPILLVALCAFTKMKYFTMLPNELLKLSEEKKLDCYDISVYFAIFSHKNQKTGRCFPSLRRLRKILGISINTIRRSIKNLEDCIAIRHSKELGVSHSYEAVSFEDTNCITPCHLTILNNKTKELEITSFNSSKTDKTETLKRMREDLIKKKILTN